MADINLGAMTEVINDKMDRDLSNRDQESYSSLNKELFMQFMEWMTPDYTYVQNMSSPFTAPYCGVAIWNNGGTSTPTVNGVSIATAGNDSYNEGPTLIPLKKGDVLTYGADAGLARFYPYKGALL